MTTSIRPSHVAISRSIAQLNAAIQPNMFAARQRAVCAARQLQRTARSYASDAHAHHKSAEVNESFGVRSKPRIARRCSPSAIAPLPPLN